MAKLDDLLVSIGVYLGVASVVKGAESVYRVRRSGSVFALPYEANQVWLYTVAPKSIPLIREIGATQNLHSINGAIAWLYERHLLHRWPSGENERIEFVADHVLVPVAYSLGSIDNDPNRYQLAGGMTARMIDVSRATYEVWAASDGCALGEACEQASEQMGVELDAIAEIFLKELPDLLGNGMAFLDLKGGVGD